MPLVGSLVQHADLRNRVAKAMLKETRRKGSNSLFSYGFSRCFKQILWTIGHWFSMFLPKNFSDDFCNWLQLPRSNSFYLILWKVRPQCRGRPFWEISWTDSATWNLNSKIPWQSDARTHVWPSLDFMMASMGFARLRGIANRKQLGLVPLAELNFVHEPP